MARHEVVIHENTSTATHGAAPYLGSYVSKETVALSSFAKAVGEKCGLPAIQVMAIIGGAFDAIAALEREALVRVHTDLGVVCGVITGSFPTADAAFDPVRNSLELALRLDDALRLGLADAVPTIVTDANVTKLRVDNAMDLEVERPMNLIHGRRPFRVAGFNMVLTGDPDAKAYLKNALGTTFPLVIDEVVSKQLFKAHTAELLDGGDYKLFVESHAGDLAGPLQTSFRRVKYLRVEDPAPGPIDETSDGQLKVMTFTDGGQNAVFDYGHTWNGTGLGFEDSEAGWFVQSVTVKLSENDGYACNFNVASPTAFTATGDDGETPAPGTYPNAWVELLLSLTGGTGDEHEKLKLPINLRVG